MSPAQYHLKKTYITFFLRPVQGPASHHVKMVEPAIMELVTAFTINIMGPPVSKVSTFDSLNQSQSMSIYWYI